MRKLKQEGAVEAPKKRGRRAVSKTAIVETGIVVVKETKQAYLADANLYSSGIVPEKSERIFTIQNLGAADINSFEHGGWLWTVRSRQAADLPQGVAEALADSYPDTIKIVDRDYAGQPNRVAPVKKNEGNAIGRNDRAVPMNWAQEYQEDPNMPDEVKKALGIDKPPSYRCGNCGKDFGLHAQYRDHLRVHGG